MLLWSLHVLQRWLLTEHTLQGSCSSASSARGNWEEEAAETKVDCRQSEGGKLQQLTNQYTRADMQQ